MNLNEKRKEIKQNWSPGQCFELNQKIVFDLSWYLDSKARPGPFSNSMIV